MASPMGRPRRLDKTRPVRIPCMVWYSATAFRMDRICRVTGLRCSRKSLECSGGIVQLVPSHPPERSEAPAAVRYQFEGPHGRGVGAAAPQPPDAVRHIRVVGSAERRRAWDLSGKRPVQDLAVQGHLLFASCARWPCPPPPRKIDPLTDRKQRGASPLVVDKLRWTSP